MNVFRLVPLYFFWHYTSAFFDMFRIFGNLYWFLWHFFSVPDTFKTFFDPWQRLHEKYHKGLDIEAMASTLVVNILMRIVGMIMRTFLLFFALVSFLVFTFMFVIFFLVWIILPAAMVGFFIAGVGALFK